MAATGGYGGRRAGAARLLRRLVEGLRDPAASPGGAAVLLRDFVAVLGVVLRRLGDPEPAVRRPAVAALRLLVPLAALARDARRASSSSDAGADSCTTALQHQHLCDLAEHVLSRSRPPRLDESASAADVAAAALLRRIAPDAAAGAAGPTVVAAALRPYQWEGLSWLTHLRRCGLGGVLADEMGLGKSLQALAAIAVMQLEEAALLPGRVACGRWWCARLWWSCTGRARWPSSSPPPSPAGMGARW